MSERVLRNPTFSDQFRSAMEQPVSRRQVLEGAKRVAVLGGVLAVDGTAAVALGGDRLARYKQRLFPADEFPHREGALSQEEIERAEKDHKEVEVPYEGELVLGGESFIEGEFIGNDSSLYLQLPGIQRNSASRLSVFDIQIDGETDNARLIRTGIISSKKPKPKRVLLGRLDSSTLHTVKITLVDSSEETMITPDELVPTLSTSTTPLSLRSIVNEFSTFTQPRPNEEAWNDCIVKKFAIPYNVGVNRRIIQRKVATAEDSRFESLYEDWDRSYDDDWETDLIVGPDATIISVYDQVNGHLRRRYNSDYFMFGTHPLVLTTTKNGMVRPTWYYDPTLPYFADEPEIIADDGYTLMRKSKYVDPDIQEASFYELRREGRDPKVVDRLEVDFRIKQALIKTPW